MSRDTFMIYVEFLSKCVGLNIREEVHNTYITIGNIAKVQKHGRIRIQLIPGRRISLLTALLFLYQY